MYSSEKDAKRKENKNAFLLFRFFYYLTLAQYFFVFGFIGLTYSFGFLPSWTFIFTALLLPVPLLRTLTDVFRRLVLKFANNNYNYGKSNRSEDWRREIIYNDSYKFGMMMAIVCTLFSISLMVPLAEFLMQYLSGLTIYPALLLGATTFFASTTMLIFLLLKGLDRFYKPHKPNIIFSKKISATEMRGYTDVHKTAILTALAGLLTSTLLVVPMAELFSKLSFLTMSSALSISGVLLIACTIAVTKIVKDIFEKIYNTQAPLSDVFTKAPAYFWHMFISVIKSTHDDSDKEIAAEEKGMFFLATGLFIAEELFAPLSNAIYHGRKLDLIVPVDVFTGVILFASAVALSYAARKMFETAYRYYEPKTADKYLLPASAILMVGLHIYAVGSVPLEFALVASAMILTLPIMSFLATLAFGKYFYTPLELPECIGIEDKITEEPNSWNSFRKTQAVLSVKRQQPVVETEAILSKVNNDQTEAQPNNTATPLSAKLLTSRNPQ